MYIEWRWQSIKKTTQIKCVVIIYSLIELVHRKAYSLACCVYGGCLSHRKVYYSWLRLHKLEISKSSFAWKSIFVRYAQLDGFNGRHCAKFALNQALLLVSNYFVAAECDCTPYSKKFCTTQNHLDFFANYEIKTVFSEGCARENQFSNY